MSGVPLTEHAVISYAGALVSRSPAFPGFCRGFLYATSCPRTLEVLVPINYGVKNADAVVNDLFIHAWVPLVGGPNVVDMNIGKVVVDQLENGSSKNAYAFFFVPPTIGPTFNANELSIVRKCGAEWYENILVVKHGEGQKAFNVCSSDLEEVDEILTTYLKNKMLV
ncbi:hypothetical protein B0H10DRAFT_2230014 [Mycena sp. CBHHK59/15]|nr:hypothetical protein B0H10DRAFT_2230014 [Mycena sp. CBHHK59/15]